MTYNLSGLSSNTTGVFSLLQVTNDNLMFGYFGMLILMVVFVILLIAFLAGTNEAPKALVGSCFITFGLSVLMAIMGLVTPVAIFVCLASLGGSIAMSLRN